MRLSDGLIIKLMQEKKYKKKNKDKFLGYIFYQNIIDLLKCVRLGLLTTNFFIEKVKSHPYIINNEACKPLVIETLKYLYELDVDTYQVCCFFLFCGCFIVFLKDLLVQNPIARPRIPHEILFVCGGWSGGSPTSAIELYDVNFISRKIRNELFNFFRRVRINGFNYHLMINVIQF